LTIAGFYLSPEGLAFGADSTSSLLTDTGYHYFNHTQKIFEISGQPETGTLAVMFWGLGSLQAVSHRTLVAQLSDSFATITPKSVLDAANRWIDHYWAAYDVDALVVLYRGLAKKAAHDANAKPDAQMRTAEEEQQHRNLASGLVSGFCLGGYVMPDRTPSAISVAFEPLKPKPTPTVHQSESFGWWGVPNIVSRLIFGADENLKAALLKSGKWNGSSADLDAVISTQRLAHGSLPIRDAIDYVHSCIYCTIKAMKFSTLSQVCGGPIEIAVITSDRPFRWVRHKGWDAAIIDGETR
jgi:hypothetical protein